MEDKLGIIVTLRFEIIIHEVYPSYKLIFKKICASELTIFFFEISSLFI